MNRTAGNRSGLLAVLLIVVGIPVAVLGYQYGLRPMLSEHRIIDVEARTPEDGGFSPDTIRVDVGETVTLRFSAEDVTHGIAIGPGLGIDLGQIDPGHTENVTVTFDSPGIYTYYCNTWCSADHWRMRGIIEVVAAGSATADDPPDPIIDALAAASIDIDAEPQTTTGISPDVSRAGMSIESVVIPPELEEPDWLLQHSPAEGADILGTANPDLSADLLIDVVAYLWTPAEPDSATAGLYTKNCAACHGESGEGDGPAAETTIERPAAFSDVAWLRRGDIWYAKIRRGGMGTDMPNFGTLFTAEETLELVGYLWYLAFDSPPE